MKYTREMEANLPEFESAAEAREYFKEKHGKNFVLLFSDVIDGMKIYFNNLVLNEEVYERSLRYLGNDNDIDGLELLNSYQRIEIWEDGRVHMIH